MDVLELPYADANKSLLIVLPTDGDTKDLVAKARKLKLSTIRQK
jgi:serine protease inhibitor